MSHTARRRLPALAKPFSVLALTALALGGSLLPAWTEARPAATASAETAEPWNAPPFTADPAAIARAAAKVQGEEGDDVVVLLAEASYGYDEAGRETYVQRLVYRILTSGAHESWSTVEEDWEPWHQARPEVRARVVTPDGVEHPLDPATITENGTAPDEPDMFEDGRVIRAPLPATQPGAVVEQQVIVRDTAPFFAAGVVRFHGLDPGVPVRHARLTVEAPASVPLRWAVRKLPGLQPKETVSGARRRLVFEARDLAPADDPEPGLPPEVPRAAYVAFSTGRSWADLASRYSEIVDQAIQGSDLSGFLRSAGGPASSQLETINLYLSRLGNEVRYTGVELGEGGLIPRKPAETLRRRFGDCKDKAVLLTAMLRASDIPAYVALLNAAEDDADVEESLPGLGLFNHAIVVVPGAPALWIDPTDRYARAGELPAADQGRLALIASPTATGLTRTPEATAADNREVETREFFLSDLGPSRVVETTEYSGQPERDLRSYYVVEDIQAVRQSLKSYASSLYLAEDLGTVEHSRATDLSTPLRLRVEFKNARRGFTDTRNAAVGVNPAALLTRLPFEIAAGLGEEEGEDAGEEQAGARRSDYVFSRPMTLEVRYRIVPPPGFVPQPLPASRVRRFSTAILAEEYAAGRDGSVTATFRLDTGKRRISAQEFEALRSSVREALQEKTSLLMFDQAGEAHLAAGRVREALAEFQRLAAAAPDSALPRTRIARALLAGGMGEAAREEAQRASQLEPKFAPAWRDLGWILQHDDLGRRFGPGFDRAGAIAAYRKAGELDPKDAIARVDLAILLEHDAQGQRYSPRADLTAAIDEYRALRKDLGNGNVDDNLLVALVRAGRFAEAKDLAAQMKDSATGAVFSIVATAATGGAEAAVRESERKYGDDSSRADALQQAAQSLLLARRYPEAAALLERAARQSGNAAAVLSLADLLRRAKRYEDAAFPADQPATPVKRLLTLIASTREEPDARRFASLFSREVAPALLSSGDDAARLFATGFTAARKKMKTKEVPLEVALDLALGGLRETVSGNDGVGYRINFASPLDGGSTFEVYVVREGTEYKIAGVSTSLPMLGAEALRRLGRNDLEGARQWLDWASDLAGSAQAKDGDPIPRNPFPALWTRGAAAGAEDARCAAAALLDVEEAARALPALLECRTAAATDARRNALDVALALHHYGTHRYAEMAEISRRLVEAAPGSENAEGLHVLALSSLKRWDEVRALAGRRLQRNAGDETALRLLASAAVEAGDLDGAEERYTQLVGTGKAGAADFNQLAWLLLERGRIDEKTVDYGQRAAALSNYDNAAALHTLASIYAEMGKTAEAHQLILQSLAVRQGEAPDADDWYVFGRLAEHYGLPDVARKYYKRVAPPQDPADEPMSTHALAARRLVALGEEKPQKRAASR
ncbi:MAG TPA: DUF3857 domain-containing protein [Thermoanaerobaculia bacterium]|jgi:tetratricopeptide (TPR) repeat protein/transglutaminase-like putative cysteine protease